MRNLLSLVKNKIAAFLAFLLTALTGVRLALAGNRGEGFVDTAIFS